MAQEKRHIAHSDLDSFSVSVEILNNPALKGKPVLVGGYERGLLAAISHSNCIRLNNQSSSILPEPQK